MSPDPLSDVRALIAKHWGFRELRPLQEQAIQADLERRDSLVVMPTGGGKSLCYQAPAALRADEVTVVISPLISLMKDQVDHLTAAGISALRVDSTLTDSDKILAAREIKAGRVRLVFASPERMMTGRFQSFLEEIGVPHLRHRRGTLHQPLGARFSTRVPPACLTAQSLPQRNIPCLHGHGHGTGPC